MDLDVVVAYAHAESRNHRADFFVRQRFVDAGLFDVENLSLERQDRLESPVASLLRCPACGLAFDQEQLATVRIALGAIRQLTRQPSGIERTFAARVRSRALRAASLAREASIALLMIFFATAGVLFEECAQALIHECRDGPGDIRVQLALGLPFKLRLRQFHADDGHQAFTHVIAGQVLFHVLEQAHLLPRVIDRAGQRRAEAGKMRAAVDGVDVVGEAEDRLGVCVVVLQPDFHVDAVAVVLHVDGLVVQNLFAAIEMLDELRDAAVVLELGTLGLRQSSNP